MLFNSFEFFAFFITFLVVYFSLPPRFQPFVMLIGSYIFYRGGDHPLRCSSRSQRWWTTRTGLMMAGPDPRPGARRR